MGHGRLAQAELQQQHGQPHVGDGQEDRHAQGERLAQQVAQFGALSRQAVDGQRIAQPLQPAAAPQPGQADDGEEQSHSRLTNSQRAQRRPAPQGDDAGQGQRQPRSGQQPRLDPQILPAAEDVANELRERLEQRQQP